jgi:organic hydroperoxide reductase OsmC/OhrA
MTGPRLNLYQLAGLWQGWLVLWQEFAPVCAGLPRKDQRKLGIHCGIDLEWCASNNVGSITTPAGNVPYSAFGPTQCAEGPSPEVLLIAAISSCYSVTLSNILQAASLPQQHISVHADGVIVTHLGRAQFARVTVNPTIRGADALRRDAYQKAAIAARNDCLVGRSIRGNVPFVVGDVSLPLSGG